MMQQINLYQDVFHESSEALDGHKAILILVSWTVLLIFISLCLWLMTILKEEAVSQQELELENLSSEIKTLQQALEAKQIDQRIVSQNNQLQQQIKTKQAVLKLLTGEHQSYPRFSGYLDALSQQTVAGLWFTRIHVFDRGHHIQLEGKALQTELVTRQIKQLSDSQSYQQKTFETVRLYRDEALVQFVLSTQELQPPLDVTGRITLGSLASK